ncbi:MAG: hypothetical protein V2G42_03690 [bacterium JZ-2024 1]
MLRIYALRIPLFVTSGLLLPVAILFGPIFFRGEVLYDHDLTHIYYPMYLYSIRSVSQGQIPFWNPLVRLGTPHIAHPESGFFYPLWLGGLLFPPDLWFQFLILFHFVFGGIGFYLWARSLQLGPPASFFGALIFELNGFWLAKYFYFSAVCTVAWIPWVFRFAYLAFTHPGPLNRAFFVACLSLQFFSGHTQIWVYSTCALSLFVLILAPRQHLLRFFGDLLAVAGIVAIQTLPSLELVNQTERAYVTSEYLVVPSASLRLYSLLINLFPFLFRYFPESEEHASYIGLVALVLAFAGIRLIRRSHPRLLLALGIPAILSIIYALGPAFFFNFYQTRIFPFSNFLHPVRALIVLVFVLASLSAFAFHNIPHLHRRPFTARLLIFVTLVELLLYDARFLRFVPRSYYLDTPEFIRLLPSPAFQGDYRTHYIQPYFPSPRHAPLTYSEDSAIRATPISRAFISARFSLPFPGPFGGGAFTLKSARLLTNPEFGSPSVMNLLGIKYLIRDRNSPVKPPPFVHKLREGQFYEIYENPSALPRVFLAKRFEIVPNAHKQRIRNKLRRGEIDPVLAQRILEQFPIGALTRDAWDPAETALTEQLPPSQWTLKDDLPTGSLSLMDARPGLFVVQTETGAPRVLVIMEPFYPGWSASVDGNPAPVIPVNAAGKAVPVPPGSHTIRVFYQPRPFVYGAFIALATTSLWLTALLFHRFRSPSQGNPAEANTLEESP